jgi:hypothetical protein
MEPVKKSYHSKTLWINALVAVAQFFPKMRELVTPETMLQLMLVINMILRFVTKDKVQLT